MQHDSTRRAWSVDCSGKGQPIMRERVSGHHSHGSITSKEGVTIWHTSFPIPIEDKRLFVRKHHPCSGDLAGSTSLHRSLPLCGVALSEALGSLARVLRQLYRLVIGRIPGGCFA